LPEAVDMESLVTYLVAAMTAWVPVHAQPDSPEETASRYASIARDVVTVAFDEAEEPLFPGADGRAQTALLMLSIASFESAYRKTVDQGIRRGDHGRSFCLMQIRVGDGTTREGWTGRQLVTDRRMCFRTALHILHGSFNVCHRLPIEDRMSAYATGRCIENADISRSRVGRARSWWTTHTPPDATIDS
jgi:hypothetical protein